jgi:hypothetical protein
MKRTLSLLLMTMVVIVCAGQTAGIQNGKLPNAYTPETGVTRAMIDLKQFPIMSISSMAGAPFSAQVMTTVKQIGDDGAPRVFTVHDQLARDGDGRWYRESRISTKTGLPSPYGASAQVFDPVNHSVIDLSIPQKIALVVNDVPAYRFSVNLLPRIKPYARQGDYGGNASIVGEDLGERTISGVKAWGRRITETFAPEVLGSDRPVTKIVEAWYSDELGIDVAMDVKDPLHGEMIEAVQQIDRHAPDQSLFQIPPGFAVRWEQK